MGPRIRVDADTFIEEVRKSGRNEVIRGPKVLLQGYTYLVSGEEFYYFTQSKEELAMPEGVTVKEVKGILL